MPAMIRFDRVTVNEYSKTILKDISFAIATKEKVAFYGKSGSGKTTILTTIVGAHIPASGTIWFNSIPVDANTLHKVRQSVSYIAQEPVLGARTVQEALLLPFTYKANIGNLPDQKEVLKIIERLQLEPRILEKETAILSGGEKQRIAIARAMLQQKTVFILDEITSALDPESRAAVIDLFRKSDFTIVSVSHDREWMGICSRYFKVEKGKIIDISSRIPIL